MNERSVIVLRSNVQVENFNYLAVVRDWRLAAELTRAHLVLASRRWRTDTGSEIIYVEDHTGDVRFVQLAGEERHELESLLRGELDCFTEQELLDAASSFSDEVATIRGLSSLAVCRPVECDARYLEIWKTGLEHPWHSTRRAAIRTAYGCSWPQLRDIVERQLQREDRLRRPLEHLLQHLGESHRPASGPHPT